MSPKSPYPVGSIKRHAVSLAVAVKLDRHGDSFAWKVVTVDGDSYYATDQGVAEFDHVMVLSPT